MLRKLGLIFRAVSIEFRSERGGSHWIGLLVTLLPLLLIALPLIISIPAVAQGEETTSQDITELTQDQSAATDQSVRCPTPANPHNLHFECIGKPFDAVKETLTSDWKGFRTELTRLGITSTHSFTAQFMGNPSGGQSHGLTYAGTLEALIVFDLNKLFGVPGLSFNVGASYSSGRNLSEKYIGNVFSVQSSFSGRGNVNLQQMYLQQHFVDGALTLALGRLAPANTFATLPVFNNYFNGGINSVPGSLAINDPTFVTSTPGVEWGAQAMYNMTPTVQVATGVYNTNPYAAAGKDNGLNFAFQQGNTGVLMVAQIRYLYNQARRDSGSQGEYTIGGSYDSNNFRSLSSPAGKASGNYSLYAMFQQMVYRGGWDRQPKRPHVVGRSCHFAQTKCQQYAILPGWWFKLQGPHSRPREGHCLAGSDLRKFQRIHSTNIGRDGDRGQLPDHVNPLAFSDARLPICDKSGRKQQYSRRLSSGWPTLNYILTTAERQRQ